MEKILKTNGFEVRLTTEEAKTICKLGQGDCCCAFLTADWEGFTCVKKHPPFESVISDRLEKGAITSKGRGGWEGCAWPNKALKA